MIGKTISRCKILSEPGEGGIGVAYKAEAASALDHPNILTRDDRITARS